MAAKITDKVIMQLVPEISPADAKKLEDQLSKSIEKETGKGLESKMKKIFSDPKIIAGAVSAAALVVLAIASKTTDKIIDNVQKQIDQADFLATKSAQSGIPLQDFLKLQKILEFGDVEQGAAAAAITEFQKRLGDFQATGSQGDFFKPLGIKPGESGAQSFLKAVSAVQNLSGAEKASTADKFFGGLGNTALAEFLSGDLGTQSKEIAGIDFKKLAEQVTKGSDAQTKITRALAKSSTQKLLETPLDPSSIITRIEGETQRTIERSKVSVDAFVIASDAAAGAMSTFSNALTKLTNKIILGDIDDSIATSRKFADQILTD